MRGEIAPQVLWVLLAIFAVAGTGMLLNWAIRGRSDAHGRMGTRFAVQAFALAAVFVPAYLGGPWLLGAAVLLACLTSAELYGTFEEGGDTPWKLSGILIGVAFMFWSYAHPGSIGRIFVAVLALYWVLRFATGNRSDSLLARAKRTCFGVLFPFLCLAFCVEFGRADMGFGYVVFYYGMAEINDSGAYLIGSSAGKRKIFPKLSPNKTIEGVAGGLALTLALSFALWFTVPHFSVWRLLTAAVLIGVAGLAGDLFASRLKRRVGVKDYGDVVPTQGGVLDVYDAFIFIAPVFYFYLMVTGGLSA
jgi:phosphatidate cytidylyltransferase